MRSPGGAIVPYERVDELATRSPSSPPSTSGGALLDLLADLARPLRDYYCSVAPTAPINNPPYVRTPGSLTSAVNRAICANSANPLPPVRGQCNCVVYQHYAVVFGFDNNGLPKRSVVTPGNRVYGEVVDARVVPSGASSSRWQVEVLCRGVAPAGSSCNPNAPLTWEVIGSTDVGFNRPFGGRVEQYYAIRQDGQPDNCAIAPSPIPLPDPGSQVIVLPRTNPTIQRYFDVDVPITIAERGQPLSLDLQLPDGVIQVDFNMDGITFSVEGSEFDLDIDVGGLSQEISNVENNLSLEIENQTQNQNDFIQQQNENLSIQLQNQFALELQTQLGDLQVTAQVDLSPVLIAINGLGELVTQTCECEECDLKPILDRLNELDEKFSLRLDELEENLHEKLQEILDKARCYFQELYSSVVLPSVDSIQNVGQFSATHEQNVQRFDVPANAIAVGLSVTDFDPAIVRTYKLSNPESEIEVGFGHVSLVLQGRTTEFELLSTVDKLLIFPPTKLSKGVRLSLKPGVSCQVFAILGEVEPSECLE